MRRVDERDSITINNRNIRIPTCIDHLSPSNPNRIRELESEVRALRDESRALTAENTDLKGQVLQYGVDQGKLLVSGLNGANSNGGSGETSIGREITEMTNEEVKIRQLWHQMWCT